MKTKFKNLPLLLYLFLILISIGFSFLLVKWFSIKDFSPISIFIFLTLLNMTVLSLIASVFEIKSLEICENDHLIFKQLFGLVFQKIDFKDIAGFKKSKFINRIGEYPTLLIKTNSNKIYEINGFIISNIEEIEKKLSVLISLDKTIVKPAIGLKEKIIFFILGCYIVSFIWFIISFR